MKKIFLAILMIFISSINFAQNCNCSTNLKWLIETFEKNDAGFQYVIDKKGENAYLTHNKIFKEKASKITDRNDCLKLLNDWTEFFRKNHLQVVLNIPASNNQKKLSEKEIIKRYENSPKLDINTNKFFKYISNLKAKTSYEGIWADVYPYTIGIIKDTINDKREFVGFILDSESPYWQKNQIKLEIFKDENDKYRMKYYLNDHSIKIFDNVDIAGNNYLITYSFALKRIKPILKTDKYVELFIKSTYIHRPFIEKISDNTVLFRIPSFRRSQKKLIDSLISQNDSLIKTTTNLIIDLRDNYGGDDISFENIIPYLYTNPIRNFNVQFLSTKLNNKRMIDYINNDDWTYEDKEWAKKGLVKLNNHIGEFVNLEDNIIRIDTLETILPYPKRVAVLVNKRCVSATEQFVLIAKQSKKVKIFGETTGGALDISNMYSVNSPCGEYTLWYGLTKSYRIPDMTIDGIGIQPDFYFDKTIKPYEWIKRTEEILNYK